MNKIQKIKQATRNNRKHNFKQWCKKVLLFPWELCKKAWRLVCRACKAIWNWLKSIDIVGMINLTLLVAIIVLFTSLIINVTQCKQSVKIASNNTDNKSQVIDNRKVVNRNPIKKSLPALPVQTNAKTGIKPQIKTIGVKKPIIVKQVSLPAKSLPKQNLTGDIIVDLYPSAPVLSNGVTIDGNLFLQNMRKYTLPCGAKIKGNLFIRNVDKLSFCGAFTVKGNIYVNPRSAFGPIPRSARVGGQVIL
ncbi:MAG: hypothetical protein IJL05_03540 [Alphaproteobacteria bacterium]|nr:hypothetical protein [Alphaproteobacteria bacterium]